MSCQVRYHFSILSWWTYCTGWKSIIKTCSTDHIFGFWYQVWLGCLDYFTAIFILRYIWLHVLVLISSLCLSWNSMKKPFWISCHLPVLNHKNTQCVAANCIGKPQSFSDMVISTAGSYHHLTYLFHIWNQTMRQKCQDIVII